MAKNISIETFKSVLACDVYSVKIILWQEVYEPNIHVYSNLQISTNLLEQNFKYDLKYKNARRHFFWSLLEVDGGPSRWILDVKSSARMLTSYAILVYWFDQSDKQSM